MNDKFDELSRNMAQSVTRRGALKKFGVGLAGIALAWLAFPPTAEAKGGCLCKQADYGCDRKNKAYFYCLNFCSAVCGP